MLAWQRGSVGERGNDGKGKTGYRGCGARVGGGKLAGWQVGGPVLVGKRHRCPFQEQGGNEAHGDVTGSIILNPAR